MCQCVFQVPWLTRHVTVTQYINHSCARHANVYFRKNITGVTYTKKIKAGDMFLACYNSQDKLRFGCAVKGCRN